MMAPIGLFQKNMMPLLFMTAFVLFSLAASNKVQAESGPNLAYNPNGTGFPEVTASYTCGCDNVWSTVNGIVSYTDSPRDRWTNYGSPHDTDSLVVDFGSVKTFNQIKLYLFNDGGGVQPPANYTLQYRHDGGWTNIPNPNQTPAVPEAGLNTVNFSSIASNQIKIEFFNIEPGVYSGVVELEVFGEPGVAVLSAFGSKAGDAITVQLSTVVDATYKMSADYFHVRINETSIPVTGAVYDSTDLSGHSIKLSFSSPVLLNETSVDLTVQSGAIKTVSQTFNQTIPSVRVITFKNLDLSHDNRFGVDDVVPIVVNPALSIDVNQDGVFDRIDVRSLLNQIPAQMKSEQLPE